MEVKPWLGCDPIILVAKKNIGSKVDSARFAKNTVLTTKKSRV